MYPWYEIFFFLTVWFMLSTVRFMFSTWTDLTVLVIQAIKKVTRVISGLVSGVPLLGSGDENGCRLSVTV